MIKALNHIAITVKNLNESIDWYRDKFGFKLVSKHQYQDMYFALISLKKIKIELFCFNKTTKPLPDYRKKLMDDLIVIGTKHVCFEVDNLDLMVSKLHNQKVDIIGEQDTSAFGGRYIFIKDCNGILIELYEFKFTLLQNNPLAEKN